MMMRARFVNRRLFASASQPPQRCQRHLTSNSCVAARRALLSTAPMMDVSDFCWRKLARIITKRTRLYTEMVVCNQLFKHGLAPFFFPLFAKPYAATQSYCFDAQMHPLLQQVPGVTAQLGGNESASLIAAIKLLKSSHQFDECNINLGCPAPSARAGSYGAVLLKDQRFLKEEMARVMDAARAIDFPVTVKMRCGVDESRDLDWLLDVLHSLYGSGVRHFVIHCRAALLNRTPADQRSIPQLNYGIFQQATRRMKAEFGHSCTFELNGGVSSVDDASVWLTQHADIVDAVMVGRWPQTSIFESLHQFDRLALRLLSGPTTGSELVTPTRESVLHEYCLFLAALPSCAKLQPLYSIRPLLTLYNQTECAKTWKRALLAGVRDRLEPLHIAMNAKRAIEESTNAWQPALDVHTIHRPLVDVASPINLQSDPQFAVM